MEPMTYEELRERNIRERQERFRQMGFDQLVKKIWWKIWLKLPKENTPSREGSFGNNTFYKINKVLLELIDRGCSHITTTLHFINLFRYIYIVIAFTFFK